MPGSLRLTRLRDPSFERWMDTGFTLIELLVTVAIVAILTAIAVPSYSSFVDHSRCKGAAADLVGLSLVLENAFQKTLQYPAYAAGTVIPALPSNRAGTIATDFGAWSPAQSAYFNYSVSSTSATYAVTATGQNKLACTISISSGNLRTASGADCGFTNW